ncbi:MAG: hypothetical protein R3F61_12155 [Myxococcota bacterium]
MPRTLLVTGFGPFGDVADNPASRLARALDGAAHAGFHIVGREIPVSYTRGIDATVRLAHEHRADCVLGVGVATTRSTIQLERLARGSSGPTPDVDGICTPVLPGPDCLESSLPVDLWAAALGCEVSDDAGRYVCNAWLHQVRQQLAVPVGFLHVPPAGADPVWFLDGLVRLVTSPDVP